MDSKMTREEAVEVIKGALSNIDRELANCYQMINGETASFREWIVSTEDAIHYVVKNDHGMAVVGIGNYDVPSVFTMRTAFDVCNKFIARFLDNTQIKWKTVHYKEFYKKRKENLEKARMDTLCLLKERWGVEL